MHHFHLVRPCQFPLYPFSSFTGFLIKNFLSRRRNFLKGTGRGEQDEGQQHIIHTSIDSPHHQQHDGVEKNEIHVDDQFDQSSKNLTGSTSILPKAPSIASTPSTNASLSYVTRTRPLCLVLGGRDNFHLNKNRLQLPQQVGGRLNAPFPSHASPWAPSLSVLLLCQLPL